MFFSTPDKPEGMVQCASYVCPGGWFHFSCADIDEDAVSPNEDWYCSETCEQHSSWIYCLCHTKKPLPTIQCANEECLRHQIYHKACVGLVYEQDVAHKEGNCMLYYIC